VSTNLASADSVKNFAGRSLTFLGSLFPFTLGTPRYNQAGVNSGSIGMSIKVRAQSNNTWQTRKSSFDRRNFLPNRQKQDWLTQRQRNSSFGRDELA